MNPIDQCKKNTNIVGVKNLNLLGFSFRKSFKSRFWLEWHGLFLFSESDVYLHFHISKMNKNIKDANLNNSDSNTPDFFLGWGEFLLVTKTG